MGWGVAETSWSGGSLGWGPGKGEVGSRSWIKVDIDSQRLTSQDRLRSLFKYQVKDVKLVKRHLGHPKTHRSGLF